AADIAVRGRGLTLCRGDWHAVVLASGEVDHARGAVLAIGGGGGVAVAVTAVVAQVRRVGVAAVGGDGDAAVGGAERPGRHRDGAPLRVHRAAQDVAAGARDRKRVVLGRGGRGQVVDLGHGEIDHAGGAVVVVGRGGGVGVAVTAVVAQVRRVGVAAVGGDGDAAVGGAERPGRHRDGAPLRVHRAAQDVAAGA